MASDAARKSETDARGRVQSRRPIGIWK